ncbi:hypothetical protein BGX33_004160 [Mortierella sp. NVP41]|nr:hypothetical protein BGX33_004160 [Mortierella sp. NVP41]
MVVDFAGWTDVESISHYLECLGFFAIRVAIICTIEDIIEADNPSTWEECIRKREDRLTTAFIPTTDGEHRRLKGNLCGQLRRMFLQGRHEQDNLAFAEFRNVEAMLKVAIATFMTQGGHLAFKGQLPRLVETAFGRIKIIDGEYHTTIDESFALWAADNYFQMTDPDYVQYRCDQLGRSSTEATRGKDWEFSIPNEMAPIVGWSGSMRTTDFMEITMAEFLDAHINNNNSERNGEFVPPFFYLGEQVSGPDIVFVLRFIGLALGGTVDSSLTLSPGSTSSDIICPVFVQVKLCKELLETKVIDARRTVQPAKIRNHGVNIAQYCRSHGHYINLIVSYPAEISSYFMDKPAMKKHSNNLTEVALTIDDSNIDLFSEKHFQALRHKKRLATDMAETTEAVKRFRVLVKRYSISKPAETCSATATRVLLPLRLPLVARFLVVAGTTTIGAGTDAAIAAAAPPAATGAAVVVTGITGKTINLPCLSQLSMLHHRNTAAVTAVKDSGSHRCARLRHGH